MKTTTHIKQFILDTISKRKMLFSISIVMVFIVKSLMMVLPFLVGNIIDLINTGITSVWQLSLPLGIFLGVWILALLFTPLQEYLLTKFVQESILQKSLGWIKTIFKKDLPFFSNFQVGNLVNAIDRGIASHEQLLFHMHGFLLPVIVEFTIATIFLIYLGGPALLILLVVLLTIHYFITTHIIVKRRTQIEKVNDAEDDLAGELTDILSNGIIFKLEQSVHTVIDRIEKPFTQYAKQSINLAVSSAIIESAKFATANLVTMGTIVYGVNAILLGQMSIGEMVTLISITAKCTTSFNNFLQSKKIFDQFGVDVEQLLTALDHKEFDRDGIKEKSVEHLTILPFKSNKSEAPFEISAPLTFKKGDKIAITGPTGKGKTTLLEIIAGLSSHARESLQINSNNISALSSTAQLDLMRYCPQNSYLLAGNISESVFFQKELNCKQQEILSSLELNESFSTGEKNLSERGSNLSGGEAKRLSLSRLLSKPGEVMLFDEPTSALNSEIAATVWDKLFTTAKDSILFCTTHDSSRLCDFDYIIKVDNGTIYEVESR